MLCLELGAYPGWHLGQAVTLELGTTSSMFIGPNEAGKFPHPFPKSGVASSLPPAVLCCKGTVLGCKGV